MATDKQIAANRANAKRSTGPKTIAGKARSSRNALRHGLSLSFEIDQPEREQLHDLVRIIAVDLRTSDLTTFSTEFAKSLLELRRIRQIKLAAMQPVDWAKPHPADLRRLSSLDRYERRAQTKRRRALVKLESNLTEVS